MLDEGSVYNSQLWEYSLLRLNQLEYFEPLKVDQDSEAHQDPDNGTVELLLKVKEKGKNSIGLNGGISGYNGAFLGLNYQTNNFLGLGETLSLQANLGSIQRTFLFGFTQPYFKNRPINIGFQVFNNKQDYNAAKTYATTTGAGVNLTAAQQSLTQNYNVGSDGFNFSLGYPLKRHAFQRIGVTYSLTKSNITAFSTASQTFFQSIAFRSGIQGSNPLAGIINSSIAFTYTYNTVSDPIRPHTGKEYSAYVQLAGLWGDVRYINPVIAYKRFIPMHYLVPLNTGHNVLGIRAQLGYIQGITGGRGAAEQPHVLRRRIRYARLRGARRYALRLRAHPRQLYAHESRWQLRSARSHEPARQPVHSGASAYLWSSLGRRRYQSYDQP